MSRPAAQVPLYPRKGYLGPVGKLYTLQVVTLELVIRIALVRQIQSTMALKLMSFDNWVIVFGTRFTGRLQFLFGKWIYLMKVPF